MGSGTSTEVVERLDPVVPGVRERLLVSLDDDGAHGVAMRSLRALHQIEVRPAESDDRAADTLEVVAWNLERGTHLDAAIAVLRQEHPDVALLTELDVGMARSGNRHTASELAGGLGHGCAFGVEFVELGLGDPSEVERLGADAVNDHGFHGNAITSRLALHDHLLIRIEDDGSWFDGQTDQPRVGGRMALAARVDLGGRPVVVCAVHLESESDPNLRADQLAIVLQAIDAHHGRTPCIVGGDLNTFSTSQADVRANFRALRDEDPSRFCWPVPYEPLFEIAARHGFEVDGANAAEQTMRRAAEQRPGSLLRLDWLLVRDLEVIDRSTIPAVTATDLVISDHDAVSVTVRPA